MTEHRVSSIEEYIAVVRAIRTDWERHYPTDYAEVWYRGVNDESISYSRVHTGVINVMSRAWF